MTNYVTKGGGCKGGCGCKGGSSCRGAMGHDGLSGFDMGKGAMLIGVAVLVFYFTQRRR